MKSAKSSSARAPLIKNLPETERPRERVLRVGASALSLRELIAVILGQGYRGESVLGVADRFIKVFTGTLDSLAPSPEHLFYESLENTNSLPSRINCKGIGKAGKSRILCTLELARRFSLYQQEASSPLTQPAINKFPLKKIPGDLRHHKQEWIGYIPVYSEQKLGHFHVIANGQKQSVSFNPRDLFTPLLNTQARGLLLAHNHPSGNLTASNEDLILTTQVEFLCQQFGIQFLGHWLVHGNKCEKI